MTTLVKKVAVNMIIFAELEENRFISTALQWGQKIFLGSHRVCIQTDLFLHT